MSDFKWENEQSGLLEIADGKLEYACIGAFPKDRPTIIMLHEGLGSVSTWKDFPKEVAAKTGMGVFVYSRFGYGGSSKTDLPRNTDYMTKEAMDVLPKVLEQIGFQQGILLGHSDGATIAAIYAGSTEDYRIRGAILIAPHFFCEELSIDGIQKAKVAYEEGELKSRLAKHHDNPDNAFYGWNDAWLNPDFKDMNVAEVIDYFRIPVLAIQGRDDQYGTLAQIDEIENRIYSPLDIELLDDCGHSPHKEQPAKTLEAIAEFAARLDRIEREEVKIA